MENKTDPYVGFDPTQMQGQGCCGEKVFDFQTGAWVVKKQPPTCEELLEKAKEEKVRAISEKDQSLQARKLAEGERDQALAKLADYEKKQPDCPLVSVYSIGDKHLFDAYKCGEGMTSIGGETISGAGVGLPEDDLGENGEG